MEDRIFLLQEAAWDQARLKDLPPDGSISVDKTKEIIPARNFGITVIRKIAPDLEQYISTGQLISYLQKREIATSTAEYQRLTKENVTPIERSQCLRNILFAAAQSSRSEDLVRNLYLALLDSYENDSGLARHHYLAVHHLRAEALRARGIDPQEHDKKQQDLAVIIRRLEPEIISGGDAFALRQRLKLENKTAAESVGQICEEWLRKSSRSLEDLVQALLCIPGLGRLASKLLPLCFCNTQTIYAFIKSLGHQWKRFALHLGFTQKEIDAIVEFCSAEDINSQIKMFLRFWWMPCCGLQTQAILEEAKKCAHIIDSTNVVAGGDQRADTHMVPGNLLAVYHNQYSTAPCAAPGAAFYFFINGAGPTQPLPAPPYTVCREQTNVETSSPPKCSLQTVVTETEGTQSPTTSELITIEPPTEVQPTIPLSEDSRLLTQHSSLETEEQPEVADELYESATDQNTTTHDATKDENQNDGAALLAACMNSEWDMGQALVDSKSFLEARSKPDDRTPLLHTCIKGNVAFVKYLVAHYANIAAVDSHGRCCLHFHEVLKNEELMKYLVDVFLVLEISVDMLDENKNSPLTVACSIGDSVVHSIHLLLDHNANPDGNKHARCQPLIEASAHGYEQTVRLLLQYNTNPDIQDVSGCTALLKACNCSQSTVVTLLLEHGVSVNRSDHDGTTPLFSAVSANAYELIQQLILKEANINTTRYRTNPLMSGAVEETPLAHACARGFVETAELLIQNRADVNYLCSGTVPPLGFAVICRQMHVVRYLLRNNDLNKTLHGLRAPIIIAIKVQNIACAKLMITELGGEEKALKMSQQQHMFQLAEHIELYMALTKDVPETVSEELDFCNPVQKCVQDPNYYKTGEVMQSFSEVCVAAVMNSVDASEDIASVIANQHQDAGEFLHRCINGIQSPETLRQDLLSGNPAPFKFFIENKLLTVENFQFQVFRRYGDSASKFCDELIQTFRQLPGGESLPPNDIQSLLLRIFSGQLGIGCRQISSSSGRDSLPRELLPWWDSTCEYRSTMQQSPMPPSVDEDDTKAWDPCASAPSGVPNPAGPQKAHPNQKFSKQIAQGAQISPPGLERQPHIEEESEATLRKNTSQNGTKRGLLPSPSRYPQAVLGPLDEKLQGATSLVNDRTNSIPQTIPLRRSSSSSNSQSSDVQQTSRFPETQQISIEHCHEHQTPVQNTTESSGPQAHVPNRQYSSTHDGATSCKGQDSTLQEGLLQNGAERTVTAEHQQDIEHVSQSQISATASNQSRSGTPPPSEQHNSSFSQKYPLQRQETLTDPNPVGVTGDVAHYDRFVSGESGYDSQKQSFDDPTGNDPTRDNVSEKPRQDSRDLTDYCSPTQQQVMSNLGQQMQQLSYQMNQVSTTVLTMQQQIKELHQTQQEQTQTQEDILQQLQKAIPKGSRIPLAKRYLLPLGKTALHPPADVKWDPELQSKFQAELKKSPKRTPDQKDPQQKPNKSFKPHKLLQSSRQQNQSLVQDLVEQHGKFLDLVGQYL